MGMCQLYVGTDSYMQSQIYDTLLRFPLCSAEIAAKIASVMREVQLSSAVDRTVQIVTPINRRALDKLAAG